MRDIKEMARQVKMPYDYVTGEPINLEKLEAFAELVRADEREACAKVAEKLTWADNKGVASAIRARSNT